MRRPETFRCFLEAAGKRLCLLPVDVLAYHSTEEIFIVTTLDTRTVEVELGRGYEHEIVIMQLDVKDR